jgi:hypothetical protein
MNKISKLSIENKLTIYKAIRQPVWIYGVELWGCSKTLRIITSAPWFVSNLTLHNDHKIPFVHKKSHSMPTNTNYAPLDTK